MEWNKNVHRDDTQGTKSLTWDEMIWNEQRRRDEMKLKLNKTKINEKFVYRHNEH